MHTSLTIVCTFSSRFIRRIQARPSPRAIILGNNPYAPFGQKPYSDNVETSYSKSTNVNVDSCSRRHGIQGVDSGLEDHSPACRVDVVSYVLLLLFLTTGLTSLFADYTQPRLHPFHLPNPAPHPTSPPAKPSIAHSSIRSRLLIITHAQHPPPHHPTPPHSPNVPTGTAPNERINTRTQPRHEGDTEERFRGWDVAGRGIRRTRRILLSPHFER